MIAQGLRSEETLGLVLGSRSPAFSQQPGSGSAATSFAFRQNASPRAARKPTTTPAADTPQSIRLDQINVPGVKVTAIPVNPTDPIAIVNGQVITRQQLADECVARKGQGDPRHPDQPGADRPGPQEPASRRSRPPRSIRRSKTSPAGSASAAKPGCEPWTRSGGSAPCSTPRTSSTPRWPCASSATGKSP